MYHFPYKKESNVGDGKKQKKVTIFQDVSAIYTRFYGGCAKIPFFLFSTSWVSFIQEPVLRKA